ncbi:PAS domain-containing protein [Pedobacter sp. NJ-S-72]
MDFRNNIYKNIFQLSPQPMWVYDMETLFFLEVNEAAIKDYGYSREDFLNMSIKEIGKENNFKHIKKNGDVITVELKNSVFESNGRLTGLVIATDITEQLQRQQAADKCEEDLLLSETRFKALVQGGSDLTSVIDMEGKYKFLSESCITLLDIHPDKMIGKTAYNFIHLDDQERVIKNMNMLHDVHRIQIEPFRFLDGHNEWKWLTTTATNMLENPAILGIVTNSTDVTELVNKNNELRISNERYKLMLKAADEAICDWDIENDIVDWSLGFHEIFGYDLGIYNNTLWSDNIYPEDRDRALKELNDAVKKPGNRSLAF